METPNEFGGRLIDSYTKEVSLLRQSLDTL
jgi:hypothetical protein